MNNTIDIIILAAGAASRMGKIKQLLPWNKGTLLSNALESALATKARSVIVVTGANATQIKNHIKHYGVVIINNKEWATGMGSSIRCGLQHIVDNTADSKAVLLMLADQPLIDASYLKELIDKFISTEGGIVATSYEAGPGVPAIFECSHFNELLQLKKDYGARDIIATHLSTTVSVNPGGKDKDIDTLKDYADLLAQHSKANKKQ